MFRKLKLQFILANLAIITVLFVSLTGCVYIVSQINTIKHMEFFAKRLAAGINSGAPEIPRDDHNRPAPFNGRPPSDNHQRPPRPGPPDDRRPLLPPVVYVKTSSTGHIATRSPRGPLNNGCLAVFAQRAFKADRNSGIINFRHLEYYYYKTPLRKHPGQLIIFQDMKQERNIPQSLIIALSITGIIYLILAMAGSLFMAKRAIGPIQKAWQQQKDFLADASHELRTPLAVIQTNLEVVLNSPHETVASQMEWLNNIKEELRQMTALVSSLLLLARLDSKAGVMEKKLFSLANVAASVSEAFKPIAAAKNISLDTSITGEIIAYGDESNLRQLIEILLDNAIRHTPAAGNIRLQLQSVDQKIICSVSDTGEGIAAGYLAKIFDRFYQVDTARSKGQAGLGLSIAKCIVENHGGTINVISCPGSGTTFTVQLPLPKDQGKDYR